MDNETYQPRLDDILDFGNVSLAVQRVKSNKGSAGVDNMKTSELEKYVKSIDFQNLIKDVYSGDYKPSPVKMVEIPKPDGGVRMLGIPTVIDRMIQQAICQILTKVYDRRFSQYSFGFRPQIGAHDALAQAEKYVNEGCKYIVDIDLSKFFDTINRDKLMHILKQDIKDIRVLRLINKFLYAGMLSNGCLIKTKDGTPQGSPLSPLLSNIYLDVLDKELEKRGVKFCRYADDIQIYSKSIRAAYQTMGNTMKLLESKKLQLKVNREKSAVRKPSESKYLGYTFRYDYTKDCYVLSVHKESLRRFFKKINLVLRRNRGISIYQFTSELARMTIGWTNYFYLGLSKTMILRIDGRIRTKIRVILWKQWKTTKMRIRMQRKFLIRKETAANSSRGMFNVASKQLKFSLTNEVLKKKYCFQSIEDSYLKIREKRKEHTRCEQLLLF